MPHKSLAKVTAARSKKTEDVFRLANAFYKLGVAYERAGKTAQATAAYKQAQKLMKQASRAGMMAGPVGRLPNGSGRSAHAIALDIAVQREKASKVLSKHGLNSPQARAHKKRSEQLRREFEAARKRNPPKGISQKELEAILSKATPQARAQIERQLSENEAPIIRRPLRAPQFELLSTIPRGATKVRLKSGQQISRVQKLNPFPKGKPHYHVEDSNTRERYSSHGSKANALSLIKKLRKEFPTVRFGLVFSPTQKPLVDWQAMTKNPGLIDLAANLQAAQTVKDLITPKRRRKPNAPKGYFRGALWYVQQKRGRDDWRTVGKFDGTKREALARYDYLLEFGKVRAVTHVQATRDWEAGRAYAPDDWIAVPQSRNPNDSSVRSPTRTSTEVRSPTKTSTQAHTAGNITVTGGAGAGANTTVVIRKRNASSPQLIAQHAQDVALAAEQRYGYDSPQAEAARLAWRKASSRYQRSKRKRNPSLKAVSKIFQGAANGKISELKAANSAPSDLARIGKLVFVKLAGAKAQTRIPGAMVAVDKNGKLWLCGSRTPMFKRKAKPGEALDYGYMDQICYETTKKHLDGVPTEYVHAFGEDGGKRPRLLVDHEGMPILRGGDYKITADGIVN